MLELLRREGAGGELLIVIDGVQWLDRPSTAAPSFAFRCLGRLPVRVAFVSALEQFDTLGVNRESCDLGSRALAVHRILRT